MVAGENTRVVSVKGYRYQDRLVRAPNDQPRLANHHNAFHLRLHTSPTKMRIFY